MKKEELKNLIDRDLSTREIAEELDAGQSTVRYYLKKYKLKTNYNSGNKGGQSSFAREMIKGGESPFLCSCGETDKSKFVKMGNGRLHYSKCKKCHVKYTIRRLREDKKKAVEYMGGRCCKCGYNKCMGSLHFHHKDPNEKDPNWRKMRSRKFDNIKKELDKCILVCANCHGEIHYYLDD